MQLWLQGRGRMKMPVCVPDAKDVALRDAVVLQLVDEALHDVVEAGAEATARHDRGRDLAGLEVDGLARARADRPCRQNLAHLLQSAAARAFHRVTESDRGKGRVGSAYKSAP